MKRSEKIARLAAASFSATELSRMSNELLDATYRAAEPLMTAQKDELRRVVNRENRRSIRLKQQIARQQRDHQQEVEWTTKWKPLPPICTTLNVKTCLEEIGGCRQSYEKSAQLFRETGHRRHADDAAASLNRLKHLEGQMVHVGFGGL